MSDEFPRAASSEPTVLPALPPAATAAWHVVLDLSESLPSAWTLIGGQMVLLHACEAGRQPPRVSEDADILVRFKLMPKAPQVFASLLIENGFEAKVSQDNRVHRFVRDSATVDLLAPDNLGVRADLTTVPPFPTLAVPAGTQALNRTELTLVRHGEREMLVPRPDLLGAVVAKAAAMELPVDLDGERHETDLAFLLTLVEDPFEMREDLSSRERGLLRRIVTRLPNDHPVWRGFEDADAGLTALSVLGPPS